MKKMKLRAVIHKFHFIVAVVLQLPTQRGVIGQEVRAAAQ